MESSDGKTPRDMSGPMLALSRAIRPMAERTGDRDLLAAAAKLERLATEAAPEPQSPPKA